MTFIIVGPNERGLRYITFPDFYVNTCNGSEGVLKSEVRDSEVIMKYYSWMTKYWNMSIILSSYTFFILVETKLRKEYLGVHEIRKRVRCSRIRCIYSNHFLIRIMPPAYLVNFLDACYSCHVTSIITSEIAHHTRRSRRHVNLHEELPYIMDMRWHV